MGMHSNTLGKIMDDLQDDLRRSLANPEKLYLQAHRHPIHLGKTASRRVLLAAPPKKSMMRPWVPTVQSFQDCASSKAHSNDTVQLNEATSLCDIGSNLRSRRALQQAHRCQSLCQ